jgi:hypothetical protein
MKRIPHWYYVQPDQWQVMLLLVLMLLGPTTVADTGQTQRLALLVAAPWEGETAMFNDVAAIYNALRQRGFTPEEFLVLAGPLTRSVLFADMAFVGQRAREPVPTGTGRRDTDARRACGWQPTDEGSDGTLSRAEGAEGDAFGTGLCIDGRHGQSIWVALKTAGEWARRGHG